MTHPYRLPEAPERPASRRRTPRVALWLTLIPATALNVVLSALNLMALSLIAGVIAVLCVCGLVYSHLTGGKR